MGLRTGRTGCPSLTTATSRKTPGRESSRAPRARITRPPRASASSTASRACGAARSATAIRGSRSRGAAGEGARLQPRVPDGASEDLLARRANRPTRARGNGPGLLRQLGLRGGGHRPQDRGRVPPHEGRSCAHAPDRQRARLSRRGHRRDFCRRHRAQPQDVLAAPPSGPSTTCRTPTTPPNGVLARPA